jgi:hypothetical protein
MLLKVVGLCIVLLFFWLSLSIVGVILRRCFPTSSFEDPEYNESAGKKNLSGIVSPYLTVFCILWFFLILGVRIDPRDDWVSVIFEMLLGNFIAVSIFSFVFLLPFAIIGVIWRRCFRASRFEGPGYNESAGKEDLSVNVSAYLPIFCILCFFLILDVQIDSRDDWASAIFLTIIPVWIALPFIARASSNKAQTRSEYLQIKEIYKTFTFVFPFFYLGRVFFKVFSGFGHGRPFRIKGTPVVSKVSSSSEWSTRDVKRYDLPYESRIALEAVWLDSASKEHASVPAFSKLSLQLIALGAPPDLISKVFIAAGQEITHAELCFSVATSVSGRPWSPGAMPQILGERSDFESLESMILECFVDGCLMEAMSAAHAHASAQLAEEIDIKRVFSVIAEDEKSHAELSWEILNFLLTKVGSAMQERLFSEFRVMKSRPVPEFYPAHINLMIEKADSESLRRFGILPKDEADNLWAQTLQGIEHRLNTFARRDVKTMEAVL